LFSFTSIQDYHAQLLAGSCSCQEAVHFYLKQIEARPSLNAYVRVYAEEALEKARQLDDARAAKGAQADGTSGGGRPSQGDKTGNAPLGKLHGVVIALKDVICYKDHPVSAASRILQNFTSIYSATVVERLLAEEAIIIGHVNCDEFAMGSTNELSAYGKVLNPLDETRVPGGSSGGSGGAVAGALCFFLFFLFSSSAPPPAVHGKPWKRYRGLRTPAGGFLRRGRA
jgi:aspartyl-tRNA(Asn)/glutamyl-tRNA(Gln) amidotransferase subunit A